MNNVAKRFIQLAQGPLPPLPATPAATPLPLATLDAPTRAASGWPCACRCVAWAAGRAVGGGVHHHGAASPAPWRPGRRWRCSADPFYRNGPNDQGVGWNVLMSLQRGHRALAWRRWWASLGFVIGRFNFLSRMFNPLISLLRPVSPLAWLPIGLLVFKGANPAAIWTIFICSIWPMIINTAVGVQRAPQDYLNVARVLNLSEWKIATKILLPAVLPYMLTGVRLAVGTAWLVIVAAEMLTGGVGIGFWVWDEWNNLNVKNIIIAIFVIGIVGLVLGCAHQTLATAIYHLKR